MIDANHVPDVSDDEILARYVMQRNHFRPSDQTAKPELFMPHPYQELSLTRYLDANIEEVLALAKGYDEISIGAFMEVWQIVQKSYTLELSPQFRHLLYVAHQTGGISEDIKNEDLAKLDALTYVSLLPKLKSMEELGVLIRREDKGGIRFLPSKLFQANP
jgi:hypothetical protein